MSGIGGGCQGSFAGTAEGMEEDVQSCCTKWPEQGGVLDAGSVLGMINGIVFFIVKI